MSNHKELPSSYVAMPDAAFFLSEAEARQLYAGSDAAHDFDHILRVTHLGEQIALAEQSDVVARFSMQRVKEAFPRRFVLRFRL